jgi:hypothetical protein
VMYEMWRQSFHLGRERKGNKERRAIGVALVLLKFPGTIRSHSSNPSLLALGVRTW